MLFFEKWFFRSGTNYEINFISSMVIVVDECEFNLKITIQSDFLM
jgi:hypothetical protein